VLLGLIQTDQSSGDFGIQETTTRIARRLGAKKRATKNVRAPTQDWGRSTHRIRREGRDRQPGAIAVWAEKGDLCGILKRKRKLSIDAKSAKWKNKEGVRRLLPDEREIVTENILEVWTKLLSECGESSNRGKASTRKSRGGEKLWQSKATI